MRVYLPATVTILRDLLSSGRCGPAPLTGFAVTPGLREWYVDDSAEELDFQALLAAARGSLQLLDQDPLTVPRRVVVGVEVAESAVTPRPDLDRAVVHVAGEVPMRQVVAVYVDDAAAEDDVRAAARQVLEADLGSTDAQFVVDGAEGHELSWYGVQEIGPLLELL
jgi:hypothetical protein